MSDLPFTAEYAKSNRSGCKLCRTNIGKDSLRLAIMVQSPHFDGKVPTWYHFKCFWSRAKVTSSSDIKGFEAMRWEDQEKMKEKITSGGGGGSGKAGAKGGGSDTYDDYTVEYAKSGAAKCRGCGDKIAKEEVRLAKKEFDTMQAKMYGPQNLWHHVDCFVKNRDELEFGAEMVTEKISNFKHMTREDKEMLIEKLGKGNPKLKRKASSANGEPAKKTKKDTKLEKALKEQSELIWKIRDGLQRDVSNIALKALLEYNGQELPKGESRLLDRVSDNMAFGALAPCPECKGQLVYSSNQAGYNCSGNVTEWAKCMYITQTPARTAWKVPKEFHDVEYLKSYKYVKRDRVFSTEVCASTSGLVSSATLNGPLVGLTFVVLEGTEKSRADLTKAMTDLGGGVVTKIDKNVVACIVSKAALEDKKNKKSLKDAQKHNVNVVDEGFVEEVRKGGASLLIKSHGLCAWGCDPMERTKDVTDGRPKKSMAEMKRELKDELMFTKSVPHTQKMKMKGGAAVDPDSGLDDKAHVLQQKGAIYNAVLGLVDIMKGTNSYYKLQVLESDTASRCWVFRAWGRVGTTIGGNKVENFGSKNTAMEHFKDLYLEKTGNEWENRDSFEKFPNRFYPLDIDYGADSDEVKKLDTSGSTSKLPKPVQELVKMIFDVESMKKAMLEFEIDMKKMPLGKLSKKQIESAYKVLNELNQLIDDKASTTMFLDASNRFYTLIPHDFGMKKPPLLDTLDVIKNKTDMLDNLLEIEVAYSMLKSGDKGDEGGIDPLDVHYKKLITDIQVLDDKTEEFDTLRKYVKNTHASTHTMYDLEIQQVFKVDREGESKRFKPFKAFPNHKLLWHGSRTTNYAGIFSQGLRIAPPEAPVTGYMFGKGIYFADMVSKSANYCAASKSNPTGLLLLCDVALGNMYELNGAEYVTKLPKGKQSTKGCGMTCPDPAQTITSDDGYEIPLGTAMPSNAGRSSLLYNEYIVYDVSQVRMKYLLQCKYNYKF